MKTRYLLALCAIMFSTLASGCNDDFWEYVPGGQPTTEPTAIVEPTPTVIPTAIPTLFPTPTQSPNPYWGTLSCSDLSLTPEEKANCGTHSYQFENQVTSGDCYVMLDDGSLSKIRTGASTMTFNFAINAVENQTEQGYATILQKRNINTYASEWGDGGSQELIFNISGYTWSGITQSCSYLVISTLTP